MAVYGRSGAGKTYLVSTCPRPLLISFESGTMCLAGKQVDYIDATQDDNGAPVPKEKRLERLRGILTYLQTPEAAQKYDTVVIDSVTELGQCTLDHAEAKFPDSKDTFPRWGMYASVMRAMIKQFRDLPNFHVLMTALSVQDKDENGQRYMNVDLQGQIGDKFPSFFDIMMYLNVDNAGKRTLITNPTSSIIAKDRSGVLSPIEEANIGAIINKITKERANS